MVKVPSPYCSCLLRSGLGELFLEDAVRRLTRSGKGEIPGLDQYRVLRARPQLMLHYVVGLL